MPEYQDMVRGPTWGLWLIGPLLAKEVQTGSSEKLSRLPPLPTAWRHRLL